VVGTRGALPTQTIKNLEKLEIKEQGDLRVISLTALKESIDIYTNFMDYDSNPKVRSSNRLPRDLPSQTRHNEENFILRLQETDNGSTRPTADRRQQ
jgi:hypothetical protein